MAVSNMTAETLTAYYKALRRLDELRFENAEPQIGSTFFQRKLAELTAERIAHDKR